MGTTPMKTQADELVLGDWNALCSVCGRKFKASQMVQLPAGVGGPWGGKTYVCQRDYRTRQPQDFVRGIPEKMAPPWTQPPIGDDTGTGGYDAMPVENIDEDTDEVEIIVDIDPDDPTRPVIVVNPGTGLRIGTITLTNTPGVGTRTREVVINVPDDTLIDEIDDPDGVDPTINVFGGGRVGPYFDHIEFGVEPTDVEVDEAISPAVTVRAIDNEGNLMTSYTGEVTMFIANNPGGATLGGTVAVNCVAGVATFSDLSLDAEGDSYTLRAQSSGDSATSASFDVTSGYIVDAQISNFLGLITTGYSSPLALGSVTPPDFEGATILRLHTLSGTVPVATVFTLDGLHAQDAFTSLEGNSLTLLSADATFSQPSGTTSQWVWTGPAMFTAAQQYTVQINP